MSVTSTALLVPVAILVLWSLLILGWLGLTRLPAMKRLRIHPQQYPRTQDLGAALPPETQWKADNYNHLMEQPTLFYATAIALAISGDTSAASLVLAWLYVALRIVHSLVQVTRNPVTLRFGLFVLATLVLLLLAIRLLWRLVVG